MNGSGIYFFKNGNRYEGEFKDDRRCGKGTLHFNNREKYVGRFQNNRMNGKGVFFHANGDRFEGNFTNGSREGFGSFYFRNGSKYEGEYKNDKREGSGVYFSDGKVVICRYRNGELLRQGKVVKEKKLNDLMKKKWKKISVIPLERIISKKHHLKADKSEKESLELCKLYFYLRTKKFIVLSGMDGLVNLKNVLSMGLCSQKTERECLELCKQYYLLRARMSPDFCEVFGELVMLDQLHRFQNNNNNNNNNEEEEEYKKLKSDVWNGLMKEIIFKYFFSKLKKCSWTENDRTEYFENLFTKGWEKQEIPKMKRSVLSTLRDFFSCVCIPELSRIAKERSYNTKKKNNPLSSYCQDFFLSDSFRYTGLVQEETRISVEKDFNQFFLSSVLPKIDDLLELFFRELEDEFEPEEEVELELGTGPQDDDVGDDVIVAECFFFGLRWGSERVGYGLFYKEFSTGSLFSRKKVFRPLFYGRFRYTDDLNNRFVKHGSGCEEYSSLDGDLVYSGSFRNGEKDGKGRSMSIFNDRKVCVYEGTFSKGYRHGMGESFNPETGHVERGHWYNGKLDKRSVFKFDCPVISYESIEKNLYDSKVVGKGANGVIYAVKTSSFPFLSKKNKKLSFKKGGSSLNLKNKKKSSRIGSQVAVKILKTKGALEKRLNYKLIRRGIGLCRCIQSPYVLESYGIILGGNEVGYVMELCDKSIKDVIGEEKTSLAEKTRIIKETAYGMNALHTKNVMHRDLKWDNVMRSKDGTIKLTDLDTLKEDEVQWRLQTFVQTSHVGTPGFRPPEVCKGKKYTLKCDVFAFGLMIYSLLWGLKFPFITQVNCPLCGVPISQMVVQNKLEEHVTYCNLRPLITHEEAKKYPKYLIELMIQCWDKHPFNRPSFEEIVLRMNLEDRKQFSKITFQFPTHPGVPDQKMFLTKPYGKKKMVDWIEKKFNEKNNVVLMMSEDDDDGMIMHENDHQKRRSEVLLLEHDIRGTIHSDEEVVKIIQSEHRNSVVFKVTLSYVDSSFVLIKDDDNRGRRISVKEFCEIKKQNETLKEEKRVLKERERVKEGKIVRQKEEIQSFRSFLEKNKNVKRLFEQYNQKEKERRRKNDEETEGEIV